MARSLWMLLPVILVKIQKARSGTKCGLLRERGAERGKKGQGGKPWTPAPSQWFPQQAFSHTPRPLTPGGLVFHKSLGYKRYLEYITRIPLRCLLFFWQIQLPTNYKTARFSLTLAMQQSRGAVLKDFVGLHWLESPSPFETWVTTEPKATAIKNRWGSGSIQYSTTCVLQPSRLLITYNYSQGSLFANDSNLYQTDIKVAVQHSKRLPNVISGTVFTDSHPGGSRKDYNRTRQTSRCSNHQPCLGQRGMRTKQKGYREETG